MANTTSEQQLTQDVFRAGATVVASDTQLFGDPSLALFGGSGSLHQVSHAAVYSANSLYHGRHRATE